MTTKLRMKRHNRTEASILPWYYSWSLICFLLVLSFFSCACRNKSSVQHTPVDNKSISNNNSNSVAQSASQVYVPQSTLEARYKEIVKCVKAKAGFNLFGEFLEIGKYSGVFLRLDIMEYYVLVPSDAELKKLDNATLTQLIYPDVSNQTNLDFMFKHVAFAVSELKDKKVYRTMTSKEVSYDSNSKNIIIDGRQFPVIDEAILPPSIKVIFINNYLN